jgi:Tol biopolymer transport system component
MRICGPMRPTRRSRVDTISGHLSLAALFALAVGIGRPPEAAAQGAVPFERISVATDGTQANGDSDLAALSADGRYVAFASMATNLVAGDTNGVQDVFVHDRQTGQTTRVSVSSSGTQGDRASAFVKVKPAISADGRYVAFMSSATNLVPSDTNNENDIFVHERLAGQTTRVSVSSTGVEADRTCSDPVLSADGRFVSFTTSASNLDGGVVDQNNIFMHDWLTGQTEKVISPVTDSGASTARAVSGPSCTGSVPRTWRPPILTAPAAKT